MRAVIAESYERIHRSNLVGMGILPLQFPAGQNADLLKLTGEEVFEISGIRDVVEKFAAGRTVKVRAGKTEFDALVRIDTPQEALYYANGGILQYVLRQLLAAKRGASNRLINAEDMTEEEIKLIHEHYRLLVDLAKKEQRLTESHSVEDATEKNGA